MRPTIGKRPRRLNKGVARGDGLRESRALNQKWVRSGRDAEPDLGAMQVLPPMVGHLDDGVCCFQDWISIRPGFVCDVMLVRMLYFGRCTAKGEFASQGSRSPGVRTKSSGNRLHSEAWGKEDRMVGYHRQAMAMSDGSEH